MSAVPYLNRGNLTVARENLGLSTAAASKKISSSKKDLVAAWERGDEIPTWAQVTKLAKAYSIPELIFFSEKPLTRHQVIPDYRIGTTAESDEDVKKLVNLVITRQKWLEKNLRAEGWQKNQLQGTGRDVGSPRDLALFIAQKLDIQLDELRGMPNRKEALNYLIHKAEGKGIFVGKTISYHRLKVEDMRGLFVSNDYCPFIVLNRKDSLSAQIFSFVHEVAHFFRKSDSISNSLDFRGVERSVNPEEVFCNKVAAELLLPEADFIKASYSKTDIDNISDRYKVSPLFAFYRLKELGRIPGGMANSLEEAIKAEMEENLKKKAEKDALNKGGNYTNSMRDSNGNLFNRVVSNSYLESRIGYVEAANLLRFSPELV